MIFSVKQNLKKIIIVALFITTAIVVCTVFKETTGLKLKVPEGMYVNTQNMVKELNALNKEYQELSNSINNSELSSEEQDKQLSLMNEISIKQTDILNKRKLITDKELISELFGEINVQKAVLIKADKRYSLSKNMLCSFDLVDDMEKGIEANNYDKDLRYIIVQEGCLLIPIKADSNETIYFAKVKISEEIFNKLIRTANEL